MKYINEQILQKIKIDKQYKSYDSSKNKKLVSFVEGQEQSADFLHIKKKAK